MNTVGMFHDRLLISLSNYQYFYLLTCMKNVCVFSDQLLVPYVAERGCTSSEGQVPHKKLLLFLVWNLLLSCCLYSVQRQAVRLWRLRLTHEITSHVGWLSSSQRQAVRFLEAQTRAKTHALNDMLLETKRRLTEVLCTIVCVCAHVYVCMRVRMCMCCCGRSESWRRHCMKMWISACVRACVCTFCWVRSDGSQM